MTLAQRLCLSNLAHYAWSKVNDHEGWETDPAGTEAKLAKAMEDLTGLWQEIQSQAQTSNLKQP